MPRDVRGDEVELATMSLKIPNVASMQKILFWTVLRQSKPGSNNPLSPREIYFPINTPGYPPQSTIRLCQTITATLDWPSSSRASP